MDKDNNIVKNLNSTSPIFRDNPNKLFIFKKTEKLSAAFYMLSNLLSDGEPMKKEWRSIGLELLNESLNLTSKNNYLKLLTKALSLIEISYLADMISGMNYNIFKHELQGVISVVESADWLIDSSASILSQGFFEAGNIPTNSVSVSVIPRASYLKDNNIVSDRMSLKNNVVKIKDNKADASNRQEIILSLLKKSNELGIKDFVTAITGCSEKTVQRELANMITKGQIKKTGEKRWSRYSLN